MSRKLSGCDLSDQYTATPNFEALASSHLDTFQSIIKEIQQRIQKTLGICQPSSLAHKDLKEILLLVQSKETEVKSMHEEFTSAKAKKTWSKTSPDSQSQSTKSSYLNESFSEEKNPVQEFRKQGRELLNECKSALDDMKHKNQALKTIYQQPLRNGAITQRPTPDILRFQPNSPYGSQLSTPMPSILLSPTGILPPSQQEKLLLSQSVKHQSSTSSGEVLANIEKFMQGLDQRNEGQSKRIQNLTREIDTLKGQVQPNKSAINTKLDEQPRNDQQNRTSRDYLNQFLNTSPKEFWNKELQMARITSPPPTNTSNQAYERSTDKFTQPEVAKTADRINEINSTIDECSKLLARKRSNQLNTRDIDDAPQLTSSVVSSPARQMQERRLRYTSMGDSRSLLSKSDFDMNATLSRRESRLKSFFDREERMKKEQDLPEQNQSLPAKPSEELIMAQTLKRSDIERKPIYEYYSSGKDKIVYCYEDELPGPRDVKNSQLVTPSKAEEELGSTRKSCLVKRGRLSSKENSGTKAEKKIRFADEQEALGRALKFEEISDQPLSPLEQRDLNTSLPPKNNPKKTILRGEISQLDREIKRISQLLNSVVLSETI